MTAGEVVIMKSPWHGNVTEPGAWSIWYFGADYAQFLELVARADSVHTVIKVGDVINAVATRLRPQVLEIDQSLASGWFRLAWASSDLAERNPLSSDLYLDLCRGVGLVEAAREGGRHLVLVEDVSLGRCLAKLCRCAGVKVRAFVGTNLWSRIREAARAHLAFLYGLAKQRHALWRHRVDPAMLVGCTALLISWADAGEGQLRATDRFLGNLPTWLRDEGEKIGWLLNPTAWVHPIEKIAATVRQRASSAEPIVLVGALQGFLALVRAYACLLVFALAARRRLLLSGIDVSPVVQWFVGQEMSSPRLVFAALFYSIAGGLKRHGISPKVLIYTYENQPWEKAMLIGFRRALPATTLVGVQHAPFAENYLSIYPTELQWRDGTAPDLLMTIGDEFRARLLTLGAPARRIMVGGALRFPTIASEHASAPRRYGGECFKVFVTCSMDPREASELTHKVAVATAGVPGIRLLVSFHPMLEEALRAKIRGRVARLTDTVEFVADPAHGWLREVDLLVYSWSGTSFEAVALGVPAIYVESDLLLDLDKMAGRGTLRCREPAELRRMIQKLMSDGEARSNAVSAGQIFLRRCFAAPRYEFWTQLARESRATAAE